MRVACPVQWRLVGVIPSRLAPLVSEQGTFGLIPVFYPIALLVAEKATGAAQSGRCGQTLSCSHDKAVSMKPVSGFAFDCLSKVKAGGLCVTAQRIPSVGFGPMSAVGLSGLVLNSVRRVRDRRQAGCAGSLNAAGVGSCLLATTGTGVTTSAIELNARR